MAEIRIISSLDDVNTALQDLNIHTTNQVDEVEFQLDEQAPLQDAANLKVKTLPGRLGFRLINPELLECKFRAKMALETSFNRMLDASLERIDQELQPIEASIAVLKVYVLYTDQQMQHTGPLIAQRNRGVIHMIYPNPPFPIEPAFEHATQENQRVSYQPAYATQEERNDAAARDRRAQRAVWDAKLRILEARKSILEKKKIEMMLSMRAELKRVMEERSDLGIGYANYEFPPLA